MATVGLVLCVAVCADSPPPHTVVKVAITDKRFSKAEAMSLPDLTKQIEEALRQKRISMISGESTFDSAFARRYHLDIEVGFLNFYQSEAGTWFGKCMMTASMHNLATAQRAGDFHCTTSIPFSRSTSQLHQNRATWEARVLSEAAAALAQDLAGELPPLPTTVRPPPPVHRPEATPSALLGPSRHWALVVGVSRYRDERVEPLPFAAADAKAFAAWLTSETGGRYQKDHVKLLLDQDAIDPAQNYVATC